MPKVLRDPPATIHLGDCVEVMRAMADCSVDAVVCDPPYGLNFMGKEWDSFEVPGGSYGNQMAGATGRAHSHGLDVRFNSQYQEWCNAWAREVLRVLKPGGYLLAFGGSRTYHRLACAVEDAGFEIRDQIQWLYGSGFPKSLDVSKAIDKTAGAAREVVGRKTGRNATPCNDIRGGQYGSAPDRVIDTSVITTPATGDARRWSGWGTALKPAHEPIVVARKPLVGTVVENVLKYGTGALNIDACRVGSGGQWQWTSPRGEAMRFGGDHSRMAADSEEGIPGQNAKGRWPANVVLDEEAGRMLDEQSGELKSGTAVGGLHRRSPKTANCYGKFRAKENEGDVCYGDSGGASRFFYCAKASRRERNEGLDGMPRYDRKLENYRMVKCNPQTGRPNDTQAVANDHPTVKPLALMEWLCKLVTPPDGLVLDPFLGSGSTALAAMRCGFRVVGVEQDQRYCEIAVRRLESAGYTVQREGFDDASTR